MNNSNMKKIVYEFWANDLGAAAAILLSANLDDIRFCNSLGIKAKRAFQLAVCCNGNYDKFNRTLSMFKCGVYSKDEIQTNLDLDEPISFIDDTLKIDGVPEYTDKQKQLFGPDNEEWEEFCVENRKVFLQKLTTQLMDQAGHEKR